MRIHLPFTFDMTYLNAETGKTSTTTASSDVLAVVPEVAIRDVELAAQWVKDGYVEKVVGWNGGIYRPANHALDPLVWGRELEALWPLADGRHANSLDRILGWPSLWTSGGKILKKAFAGRATPSRLSQGTEVLSSTEDRERTSAQHIADGFLLVDEVVWQRVPAMHLGLTPDVQHPAPNLGISAAPYGHSLTSLLHGAEGTKDPTFVRPFSLCEMDSAEKHCGELRANFENLEVFQPDLLAYDSQSAFAARVMNYVCRSLADGIGDLESDQIRAYVTMRKAVAAWYGPSKGTVSDEAIDDLWMFQGPKTDPKGWIRKGCEIIDVYRSASPTYSAMPKLG
jgi:hypothetical protein